MRPLTKRLLAVVFLFIAPSFSAIAQVTVFEGARLIIGDGSAPIEDAAFSSRATALPRSAVRGR